ncbi:MAG: glycoside hydrolase/phage tail family protein [Pseudomonadota bacterium]
MATLVLSAAGAAVGSSIGGSVLGLSAAVIGRAAGAVAGRAIDQRLFGSGSEPVETGRVDRFRLTGASEGTPVNRTYGRIRVPGEVIWSSRFLEEKSSSRRSSGGKGSSGGSTRVDSYSYSVSLAVALCEGEISHVGRIWADGVEIDQNTVTLHVHTGRDDQQKNSKIIAVEGEEFTPAYRGTAYVVFEDLDLAPFGNRVPQFNFEVVRLDQRDANDGAVSLTSGARAVAMIPGTGEYSLATTAVRYETGPGEATTANLHGYGRQTDFVVSLDQLDAELPNCEAVSLVVSWFGDDLRCDRCEIRPKLEQNTIDGSPMAWRVAGESRATAGEVPKEEGRPLYGGTPADASVIEALREMRERNLSVLYYPFILMEQTEGNTLVDPWTGDVGQPVLPWRGRITLSLAPGVSGSPDGTSAAASEVAAFFGTASANDFQISSGSVSYSGPDEWSFRRYILHNAALCAAAGGVDAFCIGSEMRGLTQIRSAGNAFPAVAALRQLAVEVRSILGPSTKLSYAADWSEYFGYNPADGSDDHFFHLDPLWADPEIDFIGIDNYMPLSDWRDGYNHADADWGSIYDLGYLKANIAGGEGYDWYYASESDAEAQIRTPITDGAYGEPWVFRYKDLVNWWSEEHFDRPGGARASTSTDWVPQSKPIWFTEFGCAAIDKGTNQPNKFVDPKSSESILPRGSNGHRDDLIQMQYLRAMFDYWAGNDNNPVSSVYSGPMVDMDKAYIWAWDARPYPWFPALSSVWSDGDNYTLGHWLNGRVSSRPLATVVAEICSEAGIEEVDVSGLYGLVRGYVVSDVSGARSALQPLMTTYGFEALERDGRLVFRNRGGKIDESIALEWLAVHPEQDADLVSIRQSSADMSDRVRLSYVEADGNFEIRSAEAIYPGAEGDAVTQTEYNLVLTINEARAATERWLAEARVARDTARFALPPSNLALGPGDVVALSAPDGPSLYRIDRLEQQGMHLLEAVRIEPDIYQPGAAIEEVRGLPAPPVWHPPAVQFMDLPLLTGDEDPVAPHVAAYSSPWPGEIAVYSSIEDDQFDLNTLIDQASLIGVTETELVAAQPGRIDRGAALRVRVSGGALSSTTRTSLLAGANAMAIGDGTSGNWEIIQFEDATLLPSGPYELRMLLRGQLGTDALIPDVWPVGSRVVLLDGAPTQIALASNARGQARTYRVGPSAQGLDHPNYVQVTEAFSGNGLRPYAPAHLRSVVEDGGDHHISWVRRTRIDGDFWDLSEVPLGEAREEYRVRVRSGGSVVRRTDVTSTEWTYSATARASDGVAGSYVVEVAQISERYGPGLYRRIDVDG